MVGPLPWNYRVKLEVKFEELEQTEMSIKIPKMCCSGGLIVILWSDIVGDDGWGFNLIPVV